MTGAVRMGVARAAAAGRIICAGANASTEQQTASMSVASILDEAGIRESEMSFVLPVEIEGAATSQHC
jgi:hypothetical protein